MKDAPPICVVGSALEESTAGEPRPDAETAVGVDAGRARDGTGATATTTEAVRSRGSAVVNARSQIIWVGSAGELLGPGGTGLSGIVPAPAPAAVSAPAQASSETISDKASDGTSVSVDVGSAEGPADDWIGRITVGGGSPKCAAAASQPSGQGGGSATAVDGMPRVNGTKSGGSPTEDGTEKETNTAEKM